MTNLVFLGPGQRIGLPNGSTLVADSKGWASAPDRASVRACHDTVGAVIPDQFPVVTTAARPTTDQQAGLAIFDSTLGKPIWRNAANTQWVDATGATV